MTATPTFINNFWDAQFHGVKIVSEKVHDSITTLVELLDYYNSRITIEKEYNKRLSKLNASTIGNHEVGSLKLSLDKLNLGNDEILHNNNKFIKNLEIINYEALKSFYNLYKSKTTKILNHIDKLNSKKQQLASQLEQSKVNYQQSCGALKQNRLLTQTTWGKELERNELKAAKLSKEATQARKNYQIALASYKEMNDILVRDWSIALKDIYQLEIEKIQTIKVNCFHFCNSIASLCVDNDKSSDAIRTLFAKINPPQDLQSFAQAYGTGNKIYSSPLFIDYMEGMDEDNYANEYAYAEFELPNYSAILTRNYSYKDAVKSKPQTNSHVSQPTTPIHPRTTAPAPAPAPAQSQVAPLPSNSQKSVKVTRKMPEDMKSNASQDSEVFDESKKFGNSGSSSRYSDDTNYSTTSSRHWNSPRRGEKQISIVQEKINRQTKDLPTIRQTEIPHLEPKVDIQKDFSIDFIAKALEDLNSGGNGDISQFRKSVRRQQQSETQSEHLQTMQNFQSQLDRNQQVRTSQSSFQFNLPKSDFVDDHNEVATRYSRPKSMVLESLPHTPSPFKQDARRKSMIDTSVLHSTEHRRSISKSPTKSYTDLHSIMMNNRTTPVSKQKYVGKAKSRYTYKPQHEGELYMKKGWNMYIITRQEDNWFVCELAANCGDCQGMVGLVPGNYLTEGEDIF